MTQDNVFQVVGMPSKEIGWVVDNAADEDKRYNSDVTATRDFVIDETRNKQMPEKIGKKDGNH